MSRRTPPLVAAPLAALCLTLAAAPAFALTSPRALMRVRNQSVEPVQPAAALVNQSSHAPSCSNNASCSGITMQYLGGHVIANVKVYAVFWSGAVPSNVQTGVGPFYAAATNHGYMDWLAEYNTTINIQAGPVADVGTPGTHQLIGRGVYGGSFVITPTKTGINLSDNDFGPELDAQIAAGHLPAPDANTIYMLHFPAGYHIDDGSSSHAMSCMQFCAYHGGWDHGSLHAFYGVIPNQASDGCQTGCSGNKTNSVPDYFKDTTETAAHELIEAVTDPEVAWATALGKPLGWYDTETNSEGENGDMCNGGIFSDAITGLDGKIYTVQQIYSRTSKLCVSTQPASADFSVYLSPNTAAVAGGASVQVPVTTKTTGTGGSPQSLTLSVSSALPSGVTASFSSTAVTSGNSATLTLTAPGGAAAAKDAVVVVKAVAGSVVHTAALLLQVTGGGTTTPGFSLSVQSATTLVFPGKLASINVGTSNTGAGAAPTINSFNVTGLPAGVTGSFSPSSVTAGNGTTLTLSASSGANASAATPITITGTSGATTNTASGAAKVQVDGAPTVTSYAPTGGSVTGTTPVTMTAIAGAGSTLSTLIVKLDGAQINSVTPAPGATSASLNYGWNTGSVSAGSHTLSFVALDADGGTDTKTATITVTVAPANDFSLALSPSSRTISPGGPGGVFNVTTAVTSGSAESITLSQAGLPAGLTATFSPAAVSAGGSATLTVSAPAGTGAVPASTFTVLGKTSSVTGGHGVIGTITVATGPKVTITSPAPGAVLSGMTPLNATATPDANTTLTKVEFFDVTVQPAVSLGSAAASPASIVWNTAAAADGSHNLLVVATDATGATGSASMTVTVANFTSSDFVIAVTPASQTLQQGGVANYTVALTRLGGPLNVNLFVSGLPAGLAGTLLSDTVASGSTTTLQVAATTNAALTTTTFTLSGTAVGNSHTATGQVTVVLPGTGGGGMSVALSSPGDGSTLSGQVTMKATATTGAGNTLKRIDFLVDGQVVGSASASPGSYTWDTAGLSANTYALSAKAYDSAGNHAVSEVAVVTVPSLTAPAAGCASLGAPGALALLGLFSMRRRRAGRRAA